MLTYVLAIGVGLGSFALYLLGFFLPELYRPRDLIWSGVGLFYAWIAWSEADRLRGGVLWGQLAIVALLGRFVWQTLEQRWNQTPVTQRTPVAGATGSLADVVGLQSQRLWAYLRSPAVQSRIPDSVRRLPDGLTAALQTVQSRLTALWSTSIHSLKSPASSPPPSAEPPLPDGASPSPAEPSPPHPDPTPAIDQRDIHQRDIRNSGSTNGTITNGTITNGAIGKDIGRNIGRNIGRDGIPTSEPDQEDPDQGNPKSV